MIDQDEIRKEVAVKNNVWLGANDPMLQTVTIFEKALEQAVASLNEQNERNQKALLAAVKQGLVEGKVAAKEVVKTGGEYVSDQVHTAMDEAEERFKQKLMGYLKAADDMRYAAETHRNISLAAAVISVGAFIAIVVGA
jgi:FKBP-type peptidyl-prolyl cis-trans isomerase (trigger factor)